MAGLAAAAVVVAAGFDINDEFDSSWSEAAETDDDCWGLVAAACDST